MAVHCTSRVIHTSPSTGQTIHSKLDDGSTGWGEQAPYDRIMVTAAATQVPRELIRELS
ncbi:hypothetical protein AB1K89_12160 [Sporosarcina sp. 179-K 8C2 HS]|uniref:hypothetical protein n=1 Tax=Sporosarcina sp. 179-K 8C2 HS TaxID=3142387 RepID=UPI00399F0C76